MGRGQLREGEDQRGKVETGMGEERKWGGGGVALFTPTHGRWGWVLSLVSDGERPGYRREGGTGCSEGLRRGGGGGGMDMAEMQKM